MADPRDIEDIDDIEDIVDIDGLRTPSAPKTAPDGGRRFLSIWFRCCHTYGRLYRNPARTAYEGRCPKCGVTVRAGIGPSGSSHRMFEAR